MTARSRETRAFPFSPLEVRSDGRTIVGIAAPFDSPTEIRECGQTFTEVIRPGAWSRTIAERGPQKVKLLVGHDTSRLPVGRATSLREDPTGLLAEFRVSETAAGDEVLALAADGTLDGLSVGMRVIRDNWQGSTREILEASLFEVSVTPFPAYDGAKVTGVREERPLLVEARARLALLDGSAPTPTFPTGPARARLALLSKEF